MRIALSMVLVVIAATSVEAEGFEPHPNGGGAHTDLFVEVPLDYDTRVVFPFGGSHHAVPGVVTINSAPYFCKPHNLTFRGRAAFVEHLSIKHGLNDREIPGMVIVDHNQVRYVGD